MNFKFACLVLFIVLISVNAFASTVVYDAVRNNYPLKYEYVDRKSTVRTIDNKIYLALENRGTNNSINTIILTYSLDNGTTWDDLNLLADYEGSVNKPALIESDNNLHILYGGGGSGWKYDLNYMTCAKSSNCDERSDWSVPAVIDANQYTSNGIEMDINSGGWLYAIFVRTYADNSVYGLMNKVCNISNDCTNQNNWVNETLLKLSGTGHCTGGSGYPSNPVLIHDANDSMHLAYTCPNTGVNDYNYMVYFDSVGWSETEYIDDHYSEHSRLDLTVDANYTPHVVFSTIGSTDCNYGKRIQAGGSASWKFTDLANEYNTAGWSTITADEKSNVYAMWVSGTYPDTNLFYKKFDASTQTWGTTWDVNNDEATYNFTPNLIEYPKNGYLDYAYRVQASAPYWVVWDYNTYTALTADYSTVFEYTALDPENGINSLDVNFFDASSYGNVSPIAWYWLEDDVNVSTDQNITRTYSSVGDYNVCFHVFAQEVGESTIENDMHCETIDINQYPQDVNFTWTPIFPDPQETVNFSGSATDDGSISHWFWTKNGAYFADNQTPSTTFEGQDYEVCLIANDDDDLNKSKCYALEVAGTLNIQFFDENAGYGIEADVTINGTDYSSSVDSNGLLSLNLDGWTTATYTFQAWDINHSTRTWLLDLNEFSVEDYNFALLETAKGQDINFLMVDENGTILSNSMVYFYISNTNYAGINQTDSDGKITFFLNGNDVNYTYSIQTATEILDFNQTLVNVKIPKDEDSKTNLSPFTVKVSGIGSREFSNSSTDVNFYVLPNTWEYYVINVDYNADYYPRNYSVAIEGRTDLYEIQPYLTNITDGILTWFYVYDYYTRVTLPNILIITKKNLPGEGWVTIESIETDGTGTANLSFISLDPYVLEFYSEHELVYTWEVNPNTTSYYVYLSVGDAFSYIISAPIEMLITVDFYPNAGKVSSDTNTITISEVIANGSSVSISSINIFVSQGGVSLFDSNYSVVGTYSQDFNNEVVNTRFPLQVSVTITYSNGVIVKTNAWLVKFPYMQRYSLFAGSVGLFDTMKEEYGDLAVLFLAILITIMVVGACALTLVHEPSVLVLIGALVLGIFALPIIGWVNPMIFAIACLLGFAGFMFMRGGF